MKKMAAFLLLVGLASVTFAQSRATVIHIINIKWKEDATPEQIKAAVDAARELPAKYPGIRRVWTRNLKYQGQEGYNQAIVMEFESEDALRKYADSAAQQWWYKIYLPAREDSRTDDIGN
ncbi:MAG TPA: Dabb family protein [Bryobacteraceae bacterium]|nr:Dabb family protein [Bryobacteraceae bacterium]